MQLYQLYCMFHWFYQLLSTHAWLKHCTLKRSRSHIIPTLAPVAIVIIPHCRAASVSERSKANDHGLFEIAQYLHIYVCLHVHCTRLCTPYASPIMLAHVHCPSEHWLLFGAPLWGVALSLGMADSVGSAEDSPDDDSNLGRTGTATGHRKRSSSQTAAQREERLATKWLPHIPFFITSSYYSYMYLSVYIILLALRIFTLFAYPFFVITHLSNINCCRADHEVRGMCLRIAYICLVIFTVRIGTCKNSTLSRSAIYTLC